MKNTVRLQAAVALLSAFTFLCGDVAAAAPARDLRCNGCVSPRDLARTAKPGGAGYTGPVDSAVIGTTDTVITSITMDLPAAGVVIVHSTASAANTTGTRVGFLCAIVKGRAIASNAPMVVGNTAAPATPIANSRGFRETSGGLKHYNLVCHSEGGVRFLDAVLTAVYVPMRYQPRPTGTR